MNKKTLLSLMMLCFVFFGVARADELTVHNDTVENSYIPVWGLWTDNSLQHEFVYPASELANMNGKKITTLKFYSSSGNANVSWNGSFQVFLKEISTTSLTSFLGTSDATLVYEGSLSVSSQEMEITLSTPYTYNGGNLWVGVYYTSTTGYSSCSWLGESVTGASIYGRSGNNYSVNSADFLPKTTFKYGCVPPVQFTANEVGPSFATLSWTEVGNSESWYIYYYVQTYGTTGPEEESIEVFENPYTLTGLNPYTTYEAYVIPSCGVVDDDPDNSLMSNTITFSTLEYCPTPRNVAMANITDTEATVTWSDYDEVYEVQLGTLSDNSDILMNESFDNGFSNNNDWQISSTYPWIIVDGHMQSNNAGVANSTSTVSLSMYLDDAGTIQFDAECMGEGTSYDVCKFYIDDVEQFAYGAQVSGWNHYSFDVAAGEHTFTWSYTKDGSLNPDGDYFAVDNVVVGINEYEWDNSISVENPSYTFTGLDPVTEYYVHVMGVCGLGSPRPTITGWSEPIHFTTLGYYTISVSANPANAGTVSGGGEIFSGDTCTVNATANPGYYFVNWTKDGVEVGEYYEPEYTFTVSENANIVANFEQIEFYPWCTSMPEDGGDAYYLVSGEGSQSVHFGDTITIYAIPNENFTFYKWTMWSGYDDDYSYVDLSTNPTDTLVIDESFLNYYDGEEGGIELIANFVESIGDCVRPMDFSVTEVGPNLAKLGWTDLGTSQSWMIYYRPTNTPAYVPYDSIEVYQNPYTLTGLQPNTSYEAYVIPSCGIMDGIANEYLSSNTMAFTTLDACPVPFNLQVSDVTYNNATIAWTGYNDEYTLRYRVATELTDPVFSEGFEGGVIPQGWSNEGDAFWIVGVGDYTSDTTGTHSGNYNAKITHNNSQEQTYFVTPTMNLAGQNDLALSFWYINREWGSDIDELGVYYRIGEQGEWNVLWSTTEAHETWTNQVIELTDLADNYQIGFLFTDHYGYGVGLDDIVIAHEIISEWTTVTNATNPQALTNLTPSTNYEVRVMGLCGETNTEWSQPLSFTTAEAYSITVSVNPRDAGTITGAGAYEYGASCTLSATANPGYTFVNWTKDGTVVSTEASYSFTVTDHANYVANFEVAAPTFEVIARYYPSADYPYCPYVKVFWGTDLNPRFVDFESGAIPPMWNNDLTYPWVVATPDSIGGYNGNYCIMSGNGGIANSTSSIEATVTFVEDGSISFRASCYGESGDWDVCEFFIDDVQQFRDSDNPTWQTYSFNVTAGMHTFRWSYTKDGSVNPTGDAFFVDDVTFTGMSRTRNENTAYNVYRTTCSEAVTPDPALIAENVTTNQYLDEAWINLAQGDYKYGVEILDGTSGEIFWSDCLTKSHVDYFTVNATVNQETGGTVTGGGTFTYGQTCTLTALADTGYYFDSWKQDTVTLGIHPEYTFSVKENVDIVAYFEPESYYTWFTTIPENGGDAELVNDENDGFVYFGDSVKIQATPYEGYSFVKWSLRTNYGGEGPRSEEDDFMDLSTSPTYTFLLDNNILRNIHYDLEGENGESSEVKPLEFIATFTETYQITVTSEPEDGGTVYVADTVFNGGTFVNGDTLVMEAVANPGYTFVNWTRNDTVVSTNTSYDFIVSKSAAYVAHFNQDIHVITATTNPNGAGIITGAGSYHYGDTCTLSVEANPGYTFVNWTKDNTVVSTNTSYSFIVSDSAAFVANFSLDSYEITATTNPTGAGTITGAGNYNYGTSCTLTVTANPGYTFINWTKDGVAVSTNTTINFNVTEAAAYVANFSVNGYQITATANPTAGGTITGAGAYNYGNSVTLTATANTGYTFVNWTKDGEVVGTSNTLSITVTETAAYVANFTQNDYQITASTNPTGAGTITGAGSFHYGDNCSLTVTPNLGYTFVNWTKDGEVVGTSTTLSVTVTESAADVANFQLNSYEIAASANPTAGGTVSGAGTYNHFQSCTLTATENEGYTFLNWTRNGQVVSSSLSYTFTVTEAASFVANFQLNSYQITASADPYSGGSVSGAGTYNHFQTCTLTATENVGYTFLNWTKNGQVVSNSLSYTFTVTEAATYVAHFSHNSYEITATAEPEEGGSITGAGTYYHGSSCTLTATANTGYTFSRWTKNGVVVSTNPSISFTVTENASYEAYFTLNIYMITVSADPTTGGTVNGGGAYLYGESCTISAMPNAGYAFTGWTKNGTTVSTEATYTFNVTEAANYVAHFEMQNYTINVMADPNEGGTATGGGSFTYGETCTLTATPNTGYTFVNWTKNGTVVSSNANYSFTVTDNGDYVANFAVSRVTITVVANPEQGGNVYGGGTYDYGHIATLRAIANNDYVFVNWTKDGSVVSTNAIYPISVTENAEYVANFRLNVFEITAKTDPENTGDIEGLGFYNYGETCTLTVIPHSEYEFVNWTLDDEVVSESPTISFVVTEARFYTAHLVYIDGIAEQGGVSVSLFPNPTRNKLTIETSEPVNTLEIYTINGALVYKQNNCSDKIELNVGSYAIGTYTIRLTTDSTVEIRKFVKE